MVSEHPIGLVIVRNLTPSQRDSFSLSQLRTAILTTDPLSDDTVSVNKYTDVARKAGFHGSELELSMTLPDGTRAKRRADKP